MRVAAIAVALISGAALADPAPDRSWGEGDPAFAIRAPEFSGMQRHGYYVPMRDGVKIAVDVWLPKDLPSGAKLPAILEQTRYYRSAMVKSDLNGDCHPPGRSTIELFVTHGYAYVVVDVRGTGASFGTRKSEYSDAEVKDGGQIVDWIARQDWSDGKVGALGQSYTGTTAEMLLRNHHPAVKAVLPTFSGYDFYSEIVMPGGIRSTFAQYWSDLIQGLDHATPDAASPIAGPCPVDADQDRSLMKAAIAEHAKNFNLARFAEHVAFRDDRFEGRRTDDGSLFQVQREIDRAQTPLYAIVGWYDSGYTLAAIRRFLNSKAPSQHLLIGPWNHGAHAFYGPGTRQATPSSFNLAAEKLRYFDAMLKDVDEGFSASPPIRYFTTGSNRWQSTSQWPPENTRMTSWYFGADHSLSNERGEAAASDAFESDGTSNSGEHNRWRATMGPTPVSYPDRAGDDAKLLTFTSAPLESDLEVTGDPIAHMTLSADATDTDVIVYLEEVTASGEVNYVTEGELRASHRARGKLPFATPEPIHSDRRADASPLKPGKAVALDVGLLPLSHQFKAGNRIRIALASADRAQFVEHPVTATKWDVLRGGAKGSSVELPVASHR
ncbi:MAG TPA: CocE/NonD family hydrolase [Nevskiaceae bacterium]|nr:CocE/NonD family hydrolase [Nevskiaceae bacterium]